jgi:TatD DNase family protein
MKPRIRRRDAAARARSIAESHRGFIWYTAGVHPHDAASFDLARDIGAIRTELAAGAVAVGECGLDYHYDNSPREQQRAAFAAQLALAAEHDVPVVVHTRDAEDDTMAMLRDAATKGVRGVLHCYTGSHTLAELAVGVGWFVSFSGIVTFRKWTDDALLRLVPDDRILAESDSPYLAPVPYRGKRNEPAWVAQTVAHLARVRGAEPEAVASTVAANARRLFNLAPRA